MSPLADLTLSLSQLLLDPNNYRYQDDPDFAMAAEERFHEESVQSRAIQRLRDSTLNDLKKSILTNGYLPFERIVVRPYAHATTDGSEPLYVVVEGNRRTAALKWLQEDHEAGVDIPASLVDLFSAVPVTAIEDAENAPEIVLSLMGIRHVGGIKEWGGFQRAKVVTELRDEHGLDTNETASRLGMSAHEVNRRYRAYKALEQMMDDEEWGDLSEPDMYPLFHEAVAGRAIKDWLEWNDDESRFDNQENLYQFYDLITESVDDDDRTREARLPNRQAVRDLRDILPLAEARRVLFDPDGDFHQALAIARADELKRSWVREVSEAIAALQNVGALELKRLSEEDVTELEKLRSTAEELLNLRDQLFQPHPATSTS